jgi:Transposase DDE domain group 1
MRLLHTAAKTRARFDDSNLVSHAGLVPAVRLAENVGLHELVRQYVRVAAPGGANPEVKIGCLMAGMIAGADSIDGMDLLRHGAIPATFGGIRAPSTLGSFLRAFDYGTVRQLAAVHRRVLARLAAQTPLLPGADTLALVDIDSMQRRVYGASKQGAAFGHTKIASTSLLVGGLNALAATVCTPVSAPVVAAARLRGGNAASARGAATLIAEAITTARQAGATGTIVVRADSAFYAGAFVAACRRNRARFSVTVRMDSKIRRAITAIDEHAWTPIQYPNAIYDDQADATRSPGTCPTHGPGKPPGSAPLPPPTAHPQPWPPDPRPSARKEARRRRKKWTSRMRPADTTRPQLATFDKRSTTPGE